MPTKRYELTRMVCKKEVADALGLSVDQIEALVKEGKMPAPQMIDGARRWPVQEINEWLTKCPRTKPKSR